MYHIKPGEGLWPLRFWIRKGPLSIGTVVRICGEPDLDATKVLDEMFSVYKTTGQKECGFDYCDPNNERES